MVFEVYSIANRNQRINMATMKSLGVLPSKYFVWPTDVVLWYKLSSLYNTHTHTDTQIQINLFLLSLSFFSLSTLICWLGF